MHTEYANQMLTLRLGQTESRQRPVSGDWQSQHSVHFVHFGITQFGADPQQAQNACDCWHTQRTHKRTVSSLVFISRLNVQCQFCIKWL